MININEYPQLKLIAWNYHQKEISEPEALGVYESNWRYINQQLLTLKEQELINNLIKNYGNGVLNV